MEPEVNIKWMNPNPVLNSSESKLPYGHGFGPPESALDLTVSGSSQVAEAGKRDDNLHLTFRIKAELQSDSDASDADDAAQDQGCSRTIPRLPERLQRLLQQPRVKAELQTLPPEASAPKKEVASAKKAPPPVGIALARQRTNEIKASQLPATPPPVKPRPRNTPLPTAPPPPSTPLTPSAASGAAYPLSSVFFTPPPPPTAWNCGWNEPPLVQQPPLPPPPFPWQPLTDVVGFAHHPATRPFLGGLEQVNVNPTPGIPQSPYLLIPAAFLDPYQRAAAAMLWPGYAAAPPTPNWALPSEVPSAFPPLFPQTHFRFPAAAETSLFTSAAAATAPTTVPAETDSQPVDPVEEKAVSVALRPAVTLSGLNVETTESVVSPFSVNLDPVSVTPVSVNSPAPEVAQTAITTTEAAVPEVKIVPETAIPDVPKLPEAVPDIPELPEVSSASEKVPETSNQDENPGESLDSGTKPAEDSFSGLQLLSESIERFVSSSLPGQVPVNSDPEAGSSHPLDVLCAAALAADPRASEGTGSAAGSGSGTTSGEEKMRMKMTELQQQYKEKQKELKCLKTKKKEKKKKKDKNKEKKKECDGSQSKSPVQDFITPGKLQLAFSTSNLQPAASAQAIVPAIKTSYAAALASAAATQTSGSAAKKRKPDLPRKHDSECTETIVPKKRKFVHLLQWCRPEMQWKNNLSDAPISDKPKAKPSLKAEVKMKQSKSDSGTSGSDEESDHLELHCLPALQFLQLNDEADVPDVPLPVLPEEPEALPPLPEPSAETKQGLLPSCTVKEELLEEGLRVLIAEDGLFHGGCVRNIRPPDIYGVAVDGERGSRPRILSTEEILHGTILEVKPSSVHQLQQGTRICAYWSQHSRSLYPGTVSAVAPASKTHTGKHVSTEDEVDVEFDDGDTGRIPISQIRFLPQDYPVIERDPNPLQALESRRKRRVSGVVPAVTVQPRREKSDHENEEEEDKEENDKEEKKAKKKKHKKKHKKKRKHEDETEESSIVIPVSPGPITGTATVTEPINESGYQSMELGEDGGIAALAPPPRRAAAVAAAKTKQQNQQQVSPTGKSKSKMAAFLPERQLWKWLGPSFKKASKGKGRKEFYKAIHRGKEIIRVGDCAVFLSSGRPDRPYVGRIELLWQSWGGSMTVKVRWFYHPEETSGGRRLSQLKTPGALFESNHIDENDVQTISHSCQVLPLEDFRRKRKPDENLNLDGCYELFYLAGFYDPTSAHLSFEPGVLETNPAGTLQ